jgi:putative heme-binding domain-containing protein
LFAATAVFAAVGLLSASGVLRSADEAKPGVRLEIHKGDHICLIGNTLADRMQHDGWLETYLYSRFPNDDLVIRDLGFSGDEIDLRLRSAGFGSPDEHLEKQKADVIFAFFGYNESYSGAEGLNKFKHSLENLIKHTLGQKYNGNSAPRLVLLSPIAHENLHDRNLPDGIDNNQRLELYTAAMAEVAKVNNVPFVDLYEPTLKLYRTAGKPLTINGVHLTEDGDKQLAEVIDGALFAGQPAPTRDAAAMEKLRQAIVDKDLIFFNRYRTVDGYSIFGGRADLSFTDGQTNRVVAQRELEVLDVMTANRDRRVWAVANGSDLKVDDSNTQPFIPVKTNFPGKNPDGTHIFLSGEEEISKMTLGKGFKINLFASEEQFHELAKPVQMAFDAKGRLWVAAWPTYPHWKPKEEMNDKMLIFEDTKGAGRADKCTVFADHLHCPTGFEFYNNGVIVAQAPDVMYLKDSRGGDSCDTRVRILDGIDSADTHHTANSFALDPGGALYFQEGTFMHTQVETPYAPTLRNVDAGVYRYEPRTQKFEAYATYPFANPHGHAWDHWGQDFVYDGTGANPYHGALFSGHLDYPVKHGHPPQLYQQRTRPCPGVEILSSRHFPESMQGDLLVANVIGFQGILRYHVSDDGASFHGTEADPIVSSTDLNFRPSDVKIGPDGAIYFLDWHNPIIGHMQHNLRDPNRDRTHGRIYRLTYEGRPLLNQVAIAGQPIEKLLDLLKEPEDRVRYRVRIELGGRDSDQVVAVAQKWAAALDPKDPNYEHNMLEALWIHQYHNVVNVDLLKRMLGSPDFRARAAATRVLCYWRDRVPDALELLKKLAADESPRVRLEAIRAASFFRVPEAIEVVLVAQEFPSDQYLDFVRGETLRALDPFVKKAIVSGYAIPFTTPAGARYFLKNVSTDDLLKLKRNRAVYVELLSRANIRDEFRQEAVAELAKLDSKSEVRVLLDAIHDQDSQQARLDGSVIFDLVRTLTERNPADLAAVRGELESLATAAKQPVTRQLGFVALIAADGRIDPAWVLATKSLRGLQDLVSAMPMLRDPSQRAALYPKVRPLLDELPKELAGERGGTSTTGRYVRIELPGRARTLTLAEVEVYSGGRNIARQGKARQSSTDYRGDASHGIDGNTDGSYAAGGQTHTRENERNPWWEVDLGSEFPIESVAVYNRTEDEFGRRLDGFTLKVLDAAHKTVFEKLNIPAPMTSVSLAVGDGTSESNIRRAAMNALTSVRGQEASTFKALTRFAASDGDREAAIQAISRIPSASWPKQEARPLLDTLMAYIRKIPVAERTSSTALDTMQLADSLVALLPRDQGKIVRKELGELGVRVVRLATLPDQMLYDKERIVVQAGKPAEIVFENTDIMPHNLVVARPGALEELGNLADTTGTQPGALERNYVPNSSKILFASRLLMPRGSQKIDFTAPQQPGVYPYVCTFPGHWRRMRGAMYVVADLDEYLADPEAYLAKHTLTIADELLKYNRPRTEWKYADLLPAVKDMDHGRSFVQGKQLFTVANCIACHRLNGVGTVVGPDLSQLDPKKQPPDVLRDIVEPSFTINEKFQSYILTLDDGRQVTGLITEETPDEVKVMENPLAKCEPTILKKSSISERAKSPKSIMPEGLLNQLTREEILDLVAYVASHGDSRSKVFSGAPASSSRP